MFLDAFVSGFGMALGISLGIAAGFGAPLMLVGLLKELRDLARLRRGLADRRGG